MKHSFSALCVASLVLAGCAEHGPIGSEKGGECKIFPPPKYAIRGATQYDQDWADDTVESGVGGCRWPRPAPRPALLDTASAKPVAVPAKKHGIIRRIKDKVKKVESRFVSPKPPVLPTPEPPAAPTISAPAVIVAAPEPPKPAAPRSRLDELLHPTDK